MNWKDHKGSAGKKGISGGEPTRLVSDYYKLRGRDAKGIQKGHNTDVSLKTLPVQTHHKGGLT
jgi:hypothetical protein